MALLAQAGVLMSVGLLVGLRLAPPHTPETSLPCPALHPRAAQKGLLDGFEHQQGEDRRLQGWFVTAGQQPWEGRTGISRYSPDGDAPGSPTPPKAA